MPKGIKKQPAKKRAYNKKTTVLPKENTVFSNTDSSEWVPELKTSQKDTELQELAAIISIFGNWTEDQKTRNIRFLASKYWEYLKNPEMI